MENTTGTEGCPGIEATGGGPKGVDNTTGRTRSAITKKQEGGIEMSGGLSVREKAKLTTTIYEDEVTDLGIRMVPKEDIRIPDCQRGVRAAWSEYLSEKLKRRNGRKPYTPPSDVLLVRGVYWDFNGRQRLSAFDRNGEAEIKCRVLKAAARRPSKAQVQDLCYRLFVVHNSDAPLKPGELLEAPGPARDLIFSVKDRKPYRPNGTSILSHRANPIRKGAVPYGRLAVCLAAMEQRDYKVSKFTALTLANRAAKTKAAAARRLLLRVIPGAFYLGRILRPWFIWVVLAAEFGRRQADGDKTYPTDEDLRRIKTTDWSPVTNHSMWLPYVKAVLRGEESTAIRNTILARLNSSGEVHVGQR
jgi:hypothetical protein